MSAPIFKYAPDQGEHDRHANVHHGKALLQRGPLGFGRRHLSFQLAQSLFQRFKVIGLLAHRCLPLAYVLRRNGIHVGLDKHFRRRAFWLGEPAEHVAGCLAN